MTATVVVADASPFVRLGVAAALREGGLYVLAEAATAPAVEAAVLAHRPQVVLLDVELDRSLDVTRAICAAQPDIAVILLCPDSGDALVAGAAHAGACGVLPKETPLERLPRIVLGAVAGEAVLSRVQVRAMMQRLRPPSASASASLAAASCRLSAREREVLELKAGGLADRAIAARLGLSPVTVRRHASTARRKLRATSREGALQSLHDAVA